MLAAESSWTPAEDAALASLATSKAYLNPEAVAEALPARSPIAAAARWAALTRSRGHRAEHSPSSHTWAAVEDAVLLRERGVHGMCTRMAQLPPSSGHPAANGLASLLLATLHHTQHQAYSQAAGITAPPLAPLFLNTAAAAAAAPHAPTSGNDWAAIAAALPGKSSADVQARWANVLKAQVLRGTAPAAAAASLDLHAQREGMVSPLADSDDHSDFDPLEASLDSISASIHPKRARAVPPMSISTSSRLGQCEVAGGLAHTTNGAGAHPRTLSSLLQASTRSTLHATAPASLSSGAALGVASHSEAGTPRISGGTPGQNGSPKDVPPLELPRLRAASSVSESGGATPLANTMAHTHLDRPATPSGAGSKRSAHHESRSRRHSTDQNGRNSSGGSGSLPSAFSPASSSATPSIWPSSSPSGAHAPVPLRAQSGSAAMQPAAAPPVPVSITWHSPPASSTPPPNASRSRHRSQSQASTGPVRPRISSAGTKVRLRGSTYKFTTTLDSVPRSNLPTTAPVHAGDSWHDFQDSPSTGEVPPGFPSDVQMYHAHEERGAPASRRRALSAPSGPPRVLYSHPGAQPTVIQPDDSPGGRAARAAALSAMAPVAVAIPAAASGQTISAQMLAHYGEANTRALQSLSPRGEQNLGPATVSGPPIAVAVAVAPPGAATLAGLRSEPAASRMLDTPPAAVPIHSVPAALQWSSGGPARALDTSAGADMSGDVYLSLSNMSISALDISATSMEASGLQVVGRAVHLHEDSPQHAEARLAEEGAFGRGGIIEELLLSDDDDGAGEQELSADASASGGALLASGRSL